MSNWTDQSTPTFYIGIWENGKRTQRAIHSLDDERIVTLIHDLYCELARRTIQRARAVALPRIPLPPAFKAGLDSQAGQV